MTLGLFRCFAFGFERSLPFGFRCCLTFSLFGSGLALGLFRCLTFGLFGGGLALGFRRRLALSLFRRFAFRLRRRLVLGFLSSSLPLGFRRRFPFGLLRRLAPSLLGCFTARFFFLLATNFCVTTRLCFPFRTRQSGLPFCFLTLAATLFLGLSFQFFPDCGLVHYLRLNRLNFYLLRVRRTG